MSTFLKLPLNRHRIAVAIVSSALLWIAGFSPGVHAQQPALAIASEAGREVLLDRIILVGASVTAGFNISEPLGGPATSQYRLRHYIEASVKAPHEPVVAYANAFFFTNPAATLKDQLKRAAAARPSMVVALDALFWFCYGEGLSEAARLERFETGLRMLEAIPVPLIVGDIPDATGAVGGILSKEEMPELTTIQKCNERLKEWAGARKNVIVFPLARLMAAASTNEELKLVTSTWPKGQSRALLQRDGLHPSVSGLAALSMEVVSLAAASARPLVAATALEQNLQQVMTAGGARAKQEASQRADAKKKDEPNTPPAIVNPVEVIPASGGE